MKPIKQLLNRAKELSAPPAQEDPHLSRRTAEKLLIPRLRSLGFLLILIGVAFCGYATVATPYISSFQTPEELALASGLSIDDDSPPFELTEGQRLNFYVVSAVFISIGILSLFSARKHKRIHRDHP